MNKAIKNLFLSIVILSIKPLFCPKFKPLKPRTAIDIAYCIRFNQKHLLKAADVLKDYLNKIFENYQTKTFKVELELPLKQHSKDIEMATISDQEFNKALSIDFPGGYRLNLFLRNTIELSDFFYRAILIFLSKDPDFLDILRDAFNPFKISLEFGLLKNSFNTQDTVTYRIFLVRNPITGFYIIWPI